MDASSSFSHLLEQENVELKLENAKLDSALKHAAKTVADQQDEIRALALADREKDLLLNAHIVDHAERCDALLRSNIVEHAGRCQSLLRSQDTKERHLEGRNVELEHRNMELKFDIEALKTELSRIKESLQDEENASKQARSEVAAHYAKEKLLESRTVALKEQNTQLDAKVEDLETELERMKTLLTDSEVSLREARSELAEARKGLADANWVMQSRESEVHRAEKELLELRSWLEQSKIKWDSREREYVGTLATQDATVQELQRKLLEMAAGLEKTSKRVEEAVEARKKEAAEHAAEMHQVYLLRPSVPPLPPSLCLSRLLLRSRSTDPERLEQVLEEHAAAKERQKRREELYEEEIKVGKQEQEELIAQAQDTAIARETAEVAASFEQRMLEVNAKLEQEQESGRKEAKEFAESMQRVLSSNQVVSSCLLTRWVWNLRC